MNAREIVTVTEQKLAAIYDPDEARNIAMLLLDHLQLDKTSSITEVQAAAIHQFTERLLTQEPVQYILEEAWFYDIPFYVNKNVLIPRPETEELVHWIINDYKNIKAPTIVDIGTGSGCIPIILKRKLPQALVYSGDVSVAALEVAQKNAASHNCDIYLLHIDILDESQWHLLPEMDILVSNPPYIPESDQAAMRQNVLGYEPHQALFVDNSDPLIFYKKIIALAEQHLKIGGSIYFEIHEQQAEALTTLLVENKYTVTLKKDMQGKDRMLHAAKK